MKLSKQDSVKKISILGGDFIQIQLEHSGGRGYEWFLDKPYGKYFEKYKCKL